MSLKCAIKSLRTQTAANGDNNAAIVNSQCISQPVVRRLDMHPGTGTESLKG